MAVVRDIVRPVVRPCVYPVDEKYFSWSQYWARQTDLFLFFAEVSNVSEGKLYNQMRGSSDYLTVTGSPGSYTFQCPNTADYIAADTDYLWFKKWDGTRRIVTENQLISFDIPRTPVKYDYATPYTIRWIAILRSGVTITGTDRDKLFKSFELSPWWDDSFNINGIIKGNRSGEQNPWYPNLPDVQTYISDLEVELSSDQLDSLNILCESLLVGTSSSVMSEAFDTFWLWGGETEESSLKNLAKDACHGYLVEGHEPAWTQFEGYQGASGKYIATGWYPVTMGVRFTKDNASIGYYSRTNISDDYPCGAQSGADTNVTICVGRNGSNQFWARLNTNGYGNVGTNYSHLGLMSACRDTNNHAVGYRHVTKIGEAADASQDIYHVHHLGLCFRSGASGLFYSNLQQAVLFYGRYFTQAEVSAIANAIEVYMDSKGKGVVT